MRLIAVFAQVNSLPCPQSRSSVCDGNVQADVCQSRPDMGGHIVFAFVSMRVKRIVLRHGAVKEAAQIGQNVGISVFLNDQAGGSMFDKNGQ